MQYKPGSRWKSAVCSTEVVIVRPPSAAGCLSCGGHVVVPYDAVSVASAKIDGLLAGGTMLGKRYFDQSSGMEVLVTKAGDGTLSLDGRSLVLRTAKPLPSSD